MKTSFATKVTKLSFFIYIGSSQQLQKLYVSSIKVENIEINAMDHVRNLGVIFDKGMTMEKQVIKIVK